MHRYHRCSKEVLQKFEAIASRSAECIGDKGTVCFPKLHDRARRCRRLIGHLIYSGQKEVQPAFPITILSRCLEQIVVTRAMSFEVVRYIENRFGKDSVPT